uniref:Zinc finger family protein n=1 Tax=Solanum tuberosum TaxID=4113 RepID=M1ARR3_SOLTU
MRKSFKDSLKALEADIQHANTLASDYPREYDGASLQMRLSYSPCAHIFMFLVQWTDCHFAGGLGLLKILIYKVIFPFFLLRSLSAILVMKVTI